MNIHHRSSVMSLRPGPNVQPPVIFGFALVTCIVFRLIRWAPSGDLVTLGLGPSWTSGMGVPPKAKKRVQAGKIEPSSTVSGVADAAGFVPGHRELRVRLQFRRPKIRPFSSRDNHRFAARRHGVRDLTTPPGPRRSTAGFVFGGISFGGGRTRPRLGVIRKGAVLLVALRHLLVYRQL